MTRTRVRKRKRNVSQKFMSIPIVYPKTEAQEDMARSLIDNQVTLAFGPAGVGKTILAAYRASVDYLEGRVDKIIIARPYKAMGEYAGHIPGTDYEKLEPFLRPIIDNIKKFIGEEKFNAELHKNIEVVPVEKIRGRSFDEPCWILIDEAQNTSIGQMKAIITRLGDSAYCCISGDPKQTDIREKNGLVWLSEIVEDYKLNSMNTVKFTSHDIVRGKMVKEFIKVLEIIEEDRICR